MDYCRWAKPTNHPAPGARDGGSLRTRLWLTYYLPLRTRATTAAARAGRRRSGRTLSAAIGLPLAVGLMASGLLLTMAMTMRLTITALALLAAALLPPTLLLLRTGR